MGRRVSRSAKRGNTASSQCGNSVVRKLTGSPARLRVTFTPAVPLCCETTSLMRSSCAPAHSAVLAQRE